MRVHLGENTGTFRQKVEMLLSVPKPGSQPQSSSAGNTAHQPLRWLPHQLSSEPKVSLQHCSAAVVLHLVHFLFYIILAIA